METLQRVEQAISALLGVQVAGLGKGFLVHCIVSFASRFVLTLDSFLIFFTRHADLCVFSDVLIPWNRHGSGTIQLVSARSS